MEPTPECGAPVITFGYSAIVCCTDISQRRLAMKPSSEFAKFAWSASQFAAHISRKPAVAILGSVSLCGVHRIMLSIHHDKHAPQQ